jgi:hypothetical protein
MGSLLSVLAECRLDFKLEGSLVSYGPDPADIFRRAEPYIDRILRGEKAADLPLLALESMSLWRTLEGRIGEMCELLHASLVVQKNARCTLTTAGALLAIGVAHLGEAATTKKHGTMMGPQNPRAGHKNIQHTVRYSELSPERFRDFWKD